MDPTTWQAYVAGFRTSVEHGAHTGRELLDVPGIIGRPGTESEPRGRFLITDDRAFAVLEALGDPYAGVVCTHPDATQCVAHLTSLGRYQRELVTAMVNHDLSTVPDLPLDSTLLLRHAVLDAGPDQVPLVSAAAADLAFDPFDDAPTSEAFADYLGSITNSTLLAATDHDGGVRATAGSAVFGDVARVFFVSTDPVLRGRGVGTAMTAAALRAAVTMGANRACLESSVAGRGIYGRLGFANAGPVVMFSFLG